MVLSSLELTVKKDKWRANFGRALSSVGDLDLDGYQGTMNMAFLKSSVTVKVTFCLLSDLFRTAAQQWRHGVLMFSALDSRLSSLDSRSGQGHCVVFLGKTHYSHSVSLHPGIQVGTCEFNAKVIPAMDKHPI